MTCTNFTWSTSRWTIWDGHVLGSMPRACSYCGGINVADALAMIERGWRIEFTTKRYKFYLEHPGYSNVPPVKVYVDHMSAEQVKQFNALIDKQLNGEKNV